MRLGESRSHLQFSWRPLWSQTTKRHVFAYSNRYTVSGEFIAPTAVGTWPAFWLTAVVGWPPESDIGEWKGALIYWFSSHPLHPFALCISLEVGVPRNI